MGEDPNSPKCQDRQTISDIYSDLEQLADALNCPSSGPNDPKHTLCPEVEELEKIKGGAERAKQVSQVLQNIAADKAAKDEELAKGLEETVQNFESIVNILDKIIKAGKYCAEIRDFINDARDFLAAIDEINSAGCDTRQLAKGFDDLFKAAGKLGKHQPFPELDWVFQAMVNDQHFFSTVGGELDPEQRWADQFSNIQDYVPNCQK